MPVLEECIARGATIVGADAFRLYDTYGFPLELTQEIAREHGLDVDVAGFERAMEEQRERGRAAARFGGGREEIRAYEVLNVRETAFLGYERIETDTVDRGHTEGRRTPCSAPTPDSASRSCFARPPFYAEGGGQVGDTGVVVTPGGSARVTDTQKPLGELIVHAAEVVEGDGCGRRRGARIGGCGTQAGRCAEPHGDAPAARGAAGRARPARTSGGLAGRT